MPWYNKSVNWKRGNANSIYNVKMYRHNSDILMMKNIKKCFKIAAFDNEVKFNKTGDLKIIEALYMAVLSHLKPSPNVLISFALYLRFL